MRPVTPIFISLTAGSLALSGLLVASHPGPTPETERIRSHLLEVEADLRAADVSHLDAPRRAARARLLGWLGEYRERGVFPHNHTHPGERVPVFVDGHGTACAVGHLLLTGGEEALVRAVVEADNNVRVPELAHSAPLRAWLDANGLTLEEAARIQPAYGPAPESSPGPDLGYETATVVLTAATLGALAWGLDAGRGGSPDWPSVMALATGILDGGAAIKGAAGSEPGWAVAVNAVGGVMAGALGLRRLLAGSGEAVGEEGEEGTAAPALVVVPTVSAAGVGLTGRWRP